MDQSIFKIGEVSARLGLVDKNSNTLRGWTEEFKDFLSASANPAPGQPRRYTAHDAQVLNAVRDYRANHLSYEEIRERLRAGAHDVTEPSAEEPSHQEETFVAGGQALVPLAQVETLLAPLAASADQWRRLADEYRTRLEAREARIETLERRVADLYDRLDSGPRSGATGAATSASPDPAAAGAPVSVLHDTPLAPEPARANGASAGHGLPSEAAPVLFPLPTVERPVHPEQDDAIVPVHHAAPRRPWWRVWRVWRVWR